MWCHVIHLLSEAADRFTFRLQVESFKSCFNRDGMMEESNEWAIIHCPNFPYGDKMPENFTQMKSVGMHVVFAACCRFPKQMGTSHRKMCPIRG